VNSGGASAGGLNTASLPIERDAKSHERDGEAAAALWVALAQTVSSAERLPVGELEPPSAWHPSAGELTPGAGAKGLTNGAPADSTPTDRLVLRVDGGALGELEVTLDRKDGGLNVVIGMENQHLVGQALPDARALRAALEGAGVSVHSLNVVTTAEVGTVLAQKRLSPSGPKHQAEEGEEPPEGERKPQRSRKRLTLIG
jgi:hypothetical protein